MESVRIVTEEVDLCVSKEDNQYLVEMVTEESGLEMYLTKLQIKDLIKQLIDMI